jgi:hypothetical protein
MAYLAGTRVNTAGSAGSTAIEAGTAADASITRELPPRPLSIVGLVAVTVSTESSQDASLVTGDSRPNSY